MQERWYSSFKRIPTPPTALMIGIAWILKELQGTSLRGGSKSIDFNYVEPPLIQSKFSRNKTLSSRFLVNDPAFICDEYQNLEKPAFIYHYCPRYFGIISGEIILSGNRQSLHLKPGCFALLPPGLEKTTIESISKTNYLMCQPHATES